MCVSVCRITPPKLLGISSWYFLSRCMQHPRNMSTRFYDPDLKVKVTARSKVKFTVIAVYKSIVLFVHALYRSLFWTTGHIYVKIYWQMTLDHYIIFKCKESRLKVKVTASWKIRHTLIEYTNKFISGTGGTRYQVKFSGLGSRSRWLRGQS